MPGYKYRKETSEINCCLKYILFSANFLFWIFGFLFLTVGVYSMNEKDVFNNLNKSHNLMLDPAFLLICIGSIIFIIGFTGSAAALRENTFLLSLYAWSLVILLVIEMTFGMLAFILKDKGWIKEQATEGLTKLIKHYREDPDQQNLIDWLQGSAFFCCGIAGPSDWENNIYFNCSSNSIVSREACGGKIINYNDTKLQIINNEKISVPFSCCKQKKNDDVGSKQCGYEGFRDRKFFEIRCFKSGEIWIEDNSFYVAMVIISVFVAKSFDVTKTIYEKGCVRAAGEYLEQNLIIITTFVIMCTFSQIIGICFAQNLRQDIIAQKAKWH
ncbi:unnamed protein product [Diamesa tonsa]